MLPVILIGIIALLCVQACEEPGAKVNVEVFYESYCPDSKRFVLEQLNSTYSELSNIMELQLIPYGKASRRQVPSTKWYTFDCQHGDEECKGNLYQACAIQYHPDPSVHLPFIACMFESSSPNSAYRRCALKSGFDLEVLAKCNTDKEGNDLMVKYAEWTESVNAKKRLDFVPWIRMNSKDKMFSAFTEFKKTLCEEYDRMAKTTCPDATGNPQTQDIPEACRQVLPA
ncbi:gamma-interferon-inducible lysosomal thiol reductase [Ixodes scapularis]|uniref:gamma-interferon-inducible lysosomal thiol reductase n=1 Tax=Ixodes scapularis TaxID=6945 RepID=UPI001C389E21|nr:gamma-interferon-inducible lysosomal thiol reductase [Ixodes scapularis]